MINFLEFLTFNGCRHAYNVPMKDVNSLVIKAILNLACQSEDKDYFSVVKSHLNHLLPLVRNYIRSDESQNDCIYALEEYCLNNESILTPMNFIKIIQYLYDNSVLDEDIIVSWFKEPKMLPDHETEDQKKLRSRKEVILFIKWLLEAEEESSSDE